MHYILDKHDIISNKIIKRYILVDDNDTFNTINGLIKNNKIKELNKLFPDLQSLNAAVEVYKIIMRDNSNILELQGQIQIKLGILIPFQHLYWFDSTGVYKTTYNLNKRKSTLSAFYPYIADVRTSISVSQVGGAEFNISNFKDNSEINEEDIFSDDLEFDISDEEKINEEQQNKAEMKRMIELEKTEMELGNKNIYVKIDKTLINNYFRIIPTSISLLAADINHYYIVDINDIRSILVKMNIDAETIYDAYIIKYWPFISKELYINWSKNFNIKNFNIENIMYITSSKDAIYSDYIDYSKNSKNSDKDISIINIKHIDAEVKMLSGVIYDSVDLDALCKNLNAETMNNSSSYVIAFYCLMMLSNNTLCEIRNNNVLLLNNLIMMFSDADYSSLGISIFILIDDCYILLKIDNREKITFSFRYKENKNIPSIEEFKKTLIKIIDTIFRSLNSEIREILYPIIYAWDNKLYNLYIKKISLKYIISKEEISRYDFSDFNNYLNSVISKSDIVDIDNNNYLHSNIMGGIKNTLIMSIKTGNIDNNILEYYINKNELKNGFILFINSSYKSFIEQLQTTYCRIITKGLEAVIDINNISYDNYRNVVLFIKYIKNSFLNSTYKSKVKNTINTSNKLSVLKYTDPVLYSYGNKDNKNIVPYSKRCQQAHQPEILSELEFNELKKAGTKDLKNAQKYFNHTTGEVLYYLCPAKYPYFLPIIGKHPENRCQGCCQKTPSDTGAKKMILDKCLETGFMSLAEAKRIKNMFKAPNVKHIINYNKNFEAGRLYKLPETIAIKLNKFAYPNVFRVLAVETLSHGLDLKEYHCIATALGILDHREYFEEAKEKLRKMPDININIFFGDTLSNTKNEKNIYTILDNLADLIVDNSKEAAMYLIKNSALIKQITLKIFRITHNINVIYIIPPDVTFHDIESYVNLMNNSLNNKYVIILIKKENETNEKKQAGLVFYSGKDVRKGSIFLQKVFNADNKIITHFNKIMNEPDVSKAIESNYITALMLHNMGYIIKNIYVDSNCFCFGVNIGFYFPVVLYKFEPMFNKVYAIPAENELPTISTMIKFIEEYNKKQKNSDFKIIPTNWVSSTANKKDRFGLYLSTNLIWFFRGAYTSDNIYDSLEQKISYKTLDNIRKILTDNMKTKDENVDSLSAILFLEDKFEYIVSKNIKSKYRDNKTRLNINKILAEKDKNNILQKIILICEDQEDVSILIELEKLKKLNSAILENIVFNFDMKYVFSLFEAMTLAERKAEIKKIIKDDIIISENSGSNNTAKNKNIIKKLYIGKKEYDYLVDKTALNIIKYHYNKKYFARYISKNSLEKMIVTHVLNYDDSVVISLAENEIYQLPK